jgi:hypothetical protein
MDKLFKSVRKGDVVLIEGSSEISRIIKLFTNSYWSHSAFYVGDELVKPGCPYREKYENKFGIDADHLIIEANGSEGVIAVPLRKYQNHNISPNFEVIKFNIIGSESFDYKFLWRDTLIDKN